MRRRLAALGLGAASGAALLTRRFRRRPPEDSGRAERLQRELEEARQRLREDLARARGE
jgi:hypothetical protein